MFRTRPPWFALTCVTLWILQLGLMAAAFRWAGPLAAPANLWQLAALGGTLALGGMLLMQLPRALQWKPRRSLRPSPEVAAERRRIARDLHDHLGAQLVFALAILDGSKHHEPYLQSLLEKCLLDLRLIVDSMESAQMPFLDRLAQLRYRMEPALRQRGISMAWDIQMSPCTGSPDVESSAHLVAIVQEAVSNALQHANPREISVRVRDLEQPRSMCLEVCDNGCGAELSDGMLSHPPAGQGLAGMAWRARLAGGELSVLQTGEGGTCIRVVVPCTPTLGAPLNA